MNKDYTFCLTMRSKDGKIEYLNEDNRAKGYRKSWFKTEESARKHLANQIELHQFFGSTLIEWTLFNRNHGIGIIEEYKA